MPIKSGCCCLRCKTNGFSVSIIYLVSHYLFTRVSFKLSMNTFFRLIDFDFKIVLFQFLHEVKDINYVMKELKSQVFLRVCKTSTHAQKVIHFWHRSREIKCFGALRSVYHWDFSINIERVFCETFLRPFKEWPKNRNSEKLKVWRDVTNIFYFLNGAELLELIS